MNGDSKYDVPIPPMPKCEEHRLNVLYQSNILDTPPEEVYDRYTTMARRIFHAPIAYISFVDKERQWLKSRFGLNSPQTHRNHAMCAYVVLEDAPSVFTVEDASQDPRFQHSPLVLGPPYVRFYAGASLEIDGVKVGTLCIVDCKPREVRINDDNKKKVGGGKNNQGRVIFGDKESSLLKDLASIVANLIRTRREENLCNIYDRLVMNADILKLYRIPLQNVVECKEEMKQKYDTIKGIVLNHQRNGHDSQMMKELVQLYQVFCKEINRFSAISSSIISFFIDMSDMSQAPPSSSSSSKKNLQSLLPLAKHMSLMHVEGVQRNLNSFFQVSSNVNEENQSTQSNECYVKTHWINDDWNNHEHSNAQTTKTSLNGSMRDDVEDPPSLKSTVSHDVRCIYSYPVLLQLQIMILFDYYDFHEIPVIISISPQFHSNYKLPKIHQDQEERMQGRLIGSGDWLIVIEEQSSIQSSQIKKKIDFHAMLQISSIYYDKLSNNVYNQNRIEESVKSCRGNNCYVLKIPFYYTSSKSVQADPMLQTLLLPELHVMDNKGKKNDNEMNQKMKVITKVKLDPRASDNNNNNNGNHNNSRIFKRLRDYYHNFFSFSNLLSRHQKIHLK